MKFKRPESNNPAGIARAMMKEASAPVAFDEIGVNEQIVETEQFRDIRARLEARQSKPLAVKLSKTLPTNKVLLSSERFDGFVSFETGQVIYFEKERGTNVYGQMQTFELPSVQ